MAAATQAAVVHPWPALAWWLIDRILPGLLVSTVLSVVALLRLRVAQQRADERHEDLKAHVTAALADMPPRRPDPRPEEPVTTPPPPVPPAAPVPPATEAPRWGFTRHHRLAVHARTVDHLPEGSAYQRFNKRVAIWLTTRVGTMTCFWVFLVIAFLSLPATLVLANLIPAPHTPFIYKFVMSYGFIFLIDWLCQNVIQLVLLPGLMVGQNLQNSASDARAAKQFEDTEVVVDRLDTATQGGITEVLRAVEALRADLAGKS